MRSLVKYLSTKPISSPIIKASDSDIMKIVDKEIKRLGKEADLNHIDVSRVTDMSFLFSSRMLERMYAHINYTDINPNISEWNVSNVKRMSCMFSGCEKFNCDISKWDVSNVDNMYGMFCECKSFNQDLSEWDVSKVNNMGTMFADCKSFNQDLSKWDVSKVEDMSSMFNGCESFYQDISMWNVNKVKEHSSVFLKSPMRSNYKPKLNGKVWR